jgi:hypothetical protein
LQLAEQGFLAHDAQHPLVVDRPAVTLQLLGDAPIAVARKGQDDVLDRVSQRDIVCRDRLQQRVRVVPRAPDPEEPTQPPDRELRIGRLRRRDHGLSFRKGMLCNPFFRSAFSSANWPQKRSSSATRRSRLSLADTCLGVKAASPRASYSRRQRNSRLSARPCSRQI